ncbi:MAG: ribbon-helix-helix protein, CopG family [Sphingomonadales bacterium]|nr:ribbon-helix-helix protein, CopG family [Sphingomonadales bacterium]
MTRILADLPEEDLIELDALASKKKSSRAAAIREAVKMYLAHNADNKDWIKRGRGYWKDRKDIGDGLEYQLAIREDRTPYEDI